MSTNTSSRSPRKVAIVGGGSAGVVQAQQLFQINDEVGPKGPTFQPTIFERRPVLGSGLWAVDSDPGPCNILFTPSGQAYPRWETTAARYWPPGAMYEGLKTNIPADLMTYRDSPFDVTRMSGMFPTRGEVENYLVEYAQKDSRVVGCARLETSVRKIQRIEQASGNESTAHGLGSKWSVESYHHPTGETKREVYDHIVFANGRCNVPSIPPIPGLWHFKGTMHHSAWYRNPLVFRGQTVLIVGNNSSGMDIARELCGHIVRDFPGREEWLRDVEDNLTGVKVINSVEDITKPPNLDYDPRDPDSPAWSKKIRVVPRIKTIREDGVVVLEDDEELDDVDALVFATGFYVQYENVDHTLEPFKSAPLVVPSRPVIQPEELPQETALLSRLEKQPQELTRALISEVETFPVNSGPSSLDDWYLFYEADRSVAILGLPTGNVPFPLTHVQARFVAAFWAGKANMLPAIDRDIAPTEGYRWSTAIDATNRPLNAGPMPLVFSHPSDMDYLDGLISHIHGAGGQPPWEKEALMNAQMTFEETREGKADEEKQAYLDSIASKLTKGPELWYNVAAWRRRRRKENKVLRRKELGY